MKTEFLYRYGADSTPLLYTDWTSNYVSELDEGNQEEKIFHQGRRFAEAGVLNNDRSGKEMIWERVHPGFRSNEVYKNFNEAK